MSVNTSNLCMRYSSESMISVRVFMVFEACRSVYFRIYRNEQKRRTKNKARRKRVRHLRIEEALACAGRSIFANVFAIADYPSVLARYQRFFYFPRLFVLWISAKKFQLCPEEANCNVDETRWRKSATSDTIERNQIASASIRRI